MNDEIFGHNIEIIADPENEKKLYGAIKFRYAEEFDQINTRYIIACGENELEVYKKCVKIILEKYNNCIEALTKIGKNIANDKDGFYLSEHFQLEDLFIPDENPSDKWDGFNKLTYCPDDKKWYRDYS